MADTCVSNAMEDRPIVDVISIQTCAENNQIIENEPVEIGVLEAPTMERSDSVISITDCHVELKRLKLNGCKCVLGPSNVFNPVVTCRRCLRLIHTVCLKLPRRVNRPVDLLKFCPDCRRDLKIVGRLPKNTDEEQQFRLVCMESLATAIHVQRRRLEKSLDWLYSFRRQRTPPSTYHQVSIEGDELREHWMDLNDSLLTSQDPDLIDCDTDSASHWVETGANGWTPEGAEQLAMYVCQIAKDHSYHIGSNSQQEYLPKEPTQIPDLADQRNLQARSPEILEPVKVFRLIAKTDGSNLSSNANDLNNLNEFVINQKDGRIIRFQLVNGTSEETQQFYLAPRHRGPNNASNSALTNGRVVPPMTMVVDSSQRQNMCNSKYYSSSSINGIRSSIIRSDDDFARSEPLSTSVAAQFPNLRRSPPLFTNFGTPINDGSRKTYSRNAAIGFSRQPVASNFSGNKSVNSKEVDLGSSDSSLWSPMDFLETNMDTDALDS